MRHFFGVLAFGLFAFTAHASDERCDFSKAQPAPGDSLTESGAVEQHLQNIGRGNTHVASVSFLPGPMAVINGVRRTVKPDKVIGRVTICNGNTKDVTVENFEFVNSSKDISTWTGRAKKFAGFRSDDKIVPSFIVYPAPVSRPTESRTAALAR